MQSEEEKSMGIPPHWKTYFTADDVDAVAEKAGQIGGTVLFGPMDVFEAGRMVMLQDPQGAAFAVWQPKQHIGARVKHDPGAITWNELMTSDPDAAIGFYTALLGLEQAGTMGEMDYRLLKVGDTEVAGVMQITPGNGAGAAQLDGLLCRRRRRCDCCPSPVLGRQRPGARNGYPGGWTLRHPDGPPGSVLQYFQRRSSLGPSSLGKKLPFRFQPSGPTRDAIGAGGLESHLDRTGSCAPLGRKQM